jgi:hypothetical protein
MDTFLIIELIIPTLLLLVVGLVLLKLKPKYSWLNKLLSADWIFYSLILFIVIGFLLRLDNNESFGCIIMDNPTFSFDNILYSGISIGLLTFGYKTQQKNIQLIILSGELLFWLYKLFFLKGGYAVGLGGVPMVSVLWYDLVALSLRLLLIKQIAKPQLNFIWILPIVLLILFFRT